MRIILALAAVVAASAGCPPSTNDADAGVSGFRDDAGNLNGTPGVDKLGSTCARVEFDLSFCAGDPEAGCTADAQCGANERCFVHQPHCACRRTCLSDDQCDPGTACACDSNACVTALCLEGGDCPSGHCGAVREPGGCREILGYKCRTVTDVCDSDDDCRPPVVGSAACEGADAGFVCGNVSGDPCN